MHFLRSVANYCLINRSIFLIFSWLLVSCSAVIRLVPYRFDEGQDPVGLVIVLCPSKMAEFAEQKMGTVRTYIYVDIGIKALLIKANLRLIFDKFI